MWIKTDRTLVSIDGLCEIRLDRYQKDDEASTYLGAFSDKASITLADMPSTGEGRQYLDNRFAEIEDAIDHPSSKALDFREKEALKRDQGPKKFRGVGSN